MEAFEQYLDKLWHTLFGKGGRGTVAPEAVRRRNLPLRTVRAEELREIARVQRELQMLHDGQLLLSPEGRLRPAQREDALHEVQLSAVIVRAGEDSPVESLDTARLLSRADQEVAIHRVRRELTIRHLAILSEEEGRRLPYQELATTAVDPDWVMRWRDGAQDAVSISLKRYWSRLLAGEVIRPGSYSVRTMEFMRTVSRVDIEMLELCARFCFDGFIYRQPGNYFSATLHLPLFEKLEELGLLRGVYGRPESWLLRSTTADRFAAILPCGNSAIFVEGGAPQDDFRLPVYRLTRFGQEVFSLCREAADSAYLLAVAGELKKQGFEVRLGDWLQEAGSLGLFSERLAVN